MARCYICKQPIRRGDVVPGVDQGKLLTAVAHLDCVFQQTLDMQGKGDKLADVLAQYPHVAAQYDRLQRMGEARLRGDEDEVRRIARGG